MKCAELMRNLEIFAPLEMAESWDNSGLIIGDCEKDIKRILVALDATDDVIDEAIDLKADLIVTHHPMVFGSIKKVTSETHLGRKILKLIKNDIGHYAMHTNLDWTNGGTNDKLSQIVGLKNVEALRHGNNEWPEGSGLGRIGRLEKPLSLEEFSKTIKNELGLKTIRVVGELDRKIEKVAVCTGSGIEFMDDAVKIGADVFITADLRYHESQKAIERNICLIDATHYASENVIIPTIKKYIESVSNETDGKIEVIMSNVDGQVFKDI